MRNDYKTQVRVAGIRRNGATIAAAPSNFNSVDTVGYRHCAFIMHTDMSGGSKSLEFTVQDSDDNSNWNSLPYVSTFAGADALFGMCVLADAAKLRRYVRLSVTAFSGAGQAPSCIAVLFNEATTADAVSGVDVAVL